MLSMMLDQMWNHILGHLTISGRRTYGYGPNCHHYRRGRFNAFPPCSSHLPLPRLLQKVSLLAIKPNIEGPHSWHRNLTSRKLAPNYETFKLCLIFNRRPRSNTRTGQWVCKKATKKVGFKDDIQDIKSDSLNISPSVSNNPKIPTYYLIFAVKLSHCHIDVMKESEHITVFPRLGRPLLEIPSGRQWKLTSLS